MSGLQVAGLRAAYGSAVVLDGVDLRVDAGEVVGLVGRNGAGKTTTLRAISGMIHRSADGLEMLAVRPGARFN